MGSQEQQDLRELKLEVSSLRSEIQRIADAIINNRLESVKQALTSNHLRLYASQTREFIGDTVERCLRADCSRSSQCKEPFTQSVEGVMDACAHEELGDIFEKLNRELNRVQEAIEKAEGKPCQRCYVNLKNVFTNQRDDIKRITGQEATIEDKTISFDVDRLVEEVIKPLSHPIRLTILSKVFRGRAGFTDLSDATGIRGGHLIFHLEKLLEPGLLTQNGTKGSYIITEKGVKIMEKLATL